MGIIINEIKSPCKVVLRMVYCWYPQLHKVKNELSENIIPKSNLKQVLIADIVYIVINLISKSKSTLFSKTCFSSILWLSYNSSQEKSKENKGNNPPTF